MKKIYLSLMVLFGMGSFLSAQTTQGADDTFKPSGKAIVTIFTDFTNVNTNSKTDNAFEVSRAYFGYGYNFSKDFSGKVVFDVANSGGLTPSAFSAFLKNAYAEYNHGIVKADFGMVGENMFDLQESVWGKRYLYKSLQDQYGFGSSADLGAKVKLQFTPEIALDLAAYNGEGYKNVGIKSDSTIQFAVGLTVQPIKNLYARVYYDTKANQSYQSAAVTQSSFNAFVGYKSEQGTLAAEYNTQSGKGNVKGKNWSGISLYGALPIVKSFSAFARFDELSSDKLASATTGWNSVKTGTDGSVYIVGVEYVPVKGIQIAPNFRYADPSSDASKAGAKSVSTLNVNVGINF
ncbi:MAG: hypothetical protein Q8904_12290 [Bacteroidota bacterium]|nr:hypothetical protein [Bacteroidota bacterium]